MRTAFVLVLTLLVVGPRPTSYPSATAVVIPVHGPLDLRNVALVRRAVGEALERKASIVVVEIDTPGGRLDHMIAIGEQLMRLAPARTAAYVRPPASGDVMGGAISAGVYVAISCRALYMHPGTVIGASTPVHLTPEGPVEAGEKSLSLARTKFRARAEQNGYPAALVEAMVDPDLEVYEVTVDGRRAYVGPEELDRLRASGRSIEGYSLFDARDKLLTLTDRQVAETGMGRIARSRPEIYADLGLSDVTELTIGPSWSENLVGLLTSDVGAMLLLIVGLLGLWIELKTPGFGLPGIAGIAALLLYFFGHYLAGLAQALDIALFVVGVGLVLVELLVVPGTGIFAVLGLLCVAAGLVLSLQGFALPAPASAPWEVDILLSSLGRVLTSLAAAVLIFAILLRFLPRIPWASRLVLQTELAGAAPALSTASALEGRHGHAATPLRPGGKIAIDGQVLDVVADGEWIAQGEPVEILRVEGWRVVVARVKR
jgi:membrane-bound serine protease (ClpP class)